MCSPQTAQLLLQQSQSADCLLVDILIRELTINAYLPVSILSMIQPCSSESRMFVSFKDGQQLTLYLYRTSGSTVVVNVHYNEIYVEMRCKWKMLVLMCTVKLPKPLANRDFVTQRSWQDNGCEKVIVNHSVSHKVSLVGNSLLMVPCVVQNTCSVTSHTNVALCHMHAMLMLQA